MLAQGLFSASLLSAQTLNVTIGPGNTFSSIPPIHAGDTVVWTWVTGSAPHSTTSGTCDTSTQQCAVTPYWDSGVFSAGHTYNHVFNIPGTFPYFSTVDGTRMTSTITVLPAAASFSKLTNIPVDANPAFVAVADFNKDGNPDLVVAALGGDSVSILLGKGDGTFQLPIIISRVISSGPNSIAVGDYNGDGKLDLAVANGGSTPGTVSIFLGNGDGTFQPSHDITVGPGPQAIIAGDFDGDGSLDFAITYNNSVFSNTISVFLNDKSGVNYLRHDFTIGTSPSSILNALATADFNRDGLPDIAVANQGNNTVSVLLNTTSAGVLNFVPAVNFPVGIKPSSLAAADFNRNGKIDLAISNQGDNTTNSSTVTLLLNNTTGNTANFSPAGTPSIVGNLSISVAAADLNGDGVTDIAVANDGAVPNNDYVSALINDGTPSLQPPVNFTTAAFSFFVTTADLNKDGKPDLIVANRGDNSITVLLNTGQAFPPPGPPGPATHFGLSVPAGSPYITRAGAPFQVTVTAYDDFQRVVTGYSGTLRFSAPSDPLAVLPTSTTLTNGVGTFDVTLKTAGVQHLQVCDSGKCDQSVAGAITGLSSNVVVSPGPVALFHMVNSASSITAGSGFSLTVSAFDAFRNPVTNYLGTIHFLDNLAGDAAPPDYAFTNADNGTHSFLIGNWTKAGTGTITATDTVITSATGVSGSITVNPASASQFAFTAPSSAIPNAPFSATVTAMDVYSNHATGYTNSVHFSSSASAILPGNYAFTVADGGTHQFSNFKLLTQGSQTITVADCPTPGTCGTSFQQVANVSVARTNSAVALSQQPGRFIFRQAITLVATVTGSGPQPTGTVTFMDGSMVVGTPQLLNGQASLPSSSLLLHGRHEITAIYGGDLSYNSSVSAPVYSFTP